MDRGTNGTYQLGKQTGDEVTVRAEDYTYDANGNLIYVLKGTRKPDSTLQVINSRKLLWDEENRLLGINDNGFVSNYWYDASGERTVKQSYDNEGVQVNGALSAARTGTSKFTCYISPYMVVSNGGNYTKHIYMGSQRITSKVSNSGIFTDTLPTNKKKALGKDFTAKFGAQTTKIKERFDTLGVTYNGIQQTGGLISGNPVTTASSYFYHSDHLGSSSLITDITGAIVQHVEYVPFGETFIDERRTASSWTTPYLFSAKERDEETGLYYYHARYYDSRTSVWLSVDPLAEKYPGMSSYGYCADNPVKYVDPDGRNPLVWWAVRRAGIGAIVDIAVQVASEWIQGGGTFSDAWDRLEIDVFQVVRSAGENLVQGKYTSAALSAAGDMISYMLSNDDWTWEGAFLAAGEGGVSSLLGDKLASAFMKKLNLSIGGAHGKFDNQYDDFGNLMTNKNHLPTVKSYKLAGFKISDYMGSAHIITVEDHKIFLSTGSGNDAKIFRKTEAALLKAGNFLDAFDLNAAAIRKQFGNKYNKGLEQARKHFQDKVIPILEKQLNN